MTVRADIHTIYERHGLSRARLAEILHWSVADVVEAEHTDSTDDGHTAILLRIMARCEPAIVRKALEGL